MADSNNRFFEGLLLGGSLGFLFGILSAPKSGADLRRQIVDGSEDVYKQASDSIAGVKNKTERAMTNLQSKGNEAFKKATHTVQETKDQLASKLQELAGQSTKVLVGDGEPPTGN